MTRALILALFFVLGAWAGFYGDRWLHRPITINLVRHHVGVAPGSQSL